MTQTPTQLQEQFKIAANLGKVMLPRGWMSYKDAETKKILLRIAWVLPAAKAVPRPGDAAKRTDAASQLELGFMLGQDRSTTNRNMRMFCGDDAEIVSLFAKWRPGIGVVNHYGDRIQGANGDKVDRQEVLNQYNPARLADKFGAVFFDSEMDGVDGCGAVEMWTFSPEILEPLRCGCRLGQMTLNFKGCLKCGRKGYTFDPKRRMGPNPRIVLSTLQLKGIKMRGYLEITNEDIGKLCGMCENTVSGCLDQWEDLKVLQIVPGRVVYGDTIDPKTGKPAVKFRYPQRIIWLPGLLMDRDVVDRERKRFAEAAEVVFINFGLTSSLRIAKQRHAELLAMWHLSRHSVGSLWSYLRTWLIRKENCESNQVDLLFPIHKAWPGG